MQPVIYDIEPPLIPQTDWLAWGELFLLILFVATLIWLSWRLLPLLLKPLAIFWQLKKIQQKSQQQAETVSVQQLYLWHQKAKDYPLMPTSEVQQVQQWLDEACFSNQSVSRETLNDKLNQLTNAWRLKNIASWLLSVAKLKLLNLMHQLWTRLLSKGGNSD